MVLRLCVPGERSAAHCLWISATALPPGWEGLPHERPDGSYGRQGVGGGSRSDGQQTLLRVSDPCRQGARTLSSPSQGACKQKLRACRRLRHQLRPRAADLPRTCPHPQPGSYMGTETADSA